MRELPLTQKMASLSLVTVTKLCLVVGTHTQSMSLRIQSMSLRIQSINQLRNKKKWN